MYCTGLCAGRSYSVTLNLESDTYDTTSLNWTFTADGTTYSTSQQAFPAASTSPADERHNWHSTGCTIVET